MFPQEKIALMRDIVGPRHFLAQMMLECIPPDKIRLDPGALILYSDDFDPRTAKIGDNLITGVCAYWDPSGGRQKADSSVCVLVYRDDKNRHIFIHDVLYLVVSDDELHPLGRQCNMVLDFLERHHIGRIVIETNGLGNALPEIMRDVSAKRGHSVIVQKQVNNKNKENRILDAAEPLLTSGRLFLNTRVQSTPFISEMLGWSPIAPGHDDGLDAVAGAICSDCVPVRPVGHRTQIINANTNFKL